MPRGKHLSEYEKGQIMAMHRDGKSNREIARTLKRSDHVVLNYLSNPGAYGSIKRCGRRQKLSERDKRRVINAASNSCASCSKSQRECNLGVSRTTVWGAIHDSPCIHREKMKSAPYLRDHHKVARLEFARKNMSTNWNAVSYLNQLTNLLVCLLAKLSVLYLSLRLF